MSKPKKLELTWVGKHDRPKIEPRILLHDPSKSVRSPANGAAAFFDNQLIHGDNLLALKALEKDFSKKFRLVYIDPPFNTGQAFEHYDDGVEHSLWLDLMAQRLEIIKTLLSDDGVVMVHLDLEEVHYLKVVMDELFGRNQFLGQIAYERSGVSGLGQGGSFVVNTHEYILAYARDKALFKAEDLSGSGSLEAKDMKRYNRILVSPGKRKEVARFTAPSTGEDVVIYKHSDEVIDTISLRNFEEREPEIVRQYIKNFTSVHRLTSVQKENEFQNKILSFCKDGMYSADYLVSRGKREGERITSYYQNAQVFVWLRDTAEVRDGTIARTGKLSDFWTHAEIPKANLANEGSVDFRRGKKPEVLIQRLIRMVTKPGDWVLDSFAGSGTTGAVAHKMGRRWVMVEFGNHCQTHILPRLKSIIEGRDSGGITESEGWKGGGGFKYCRLAPSLLKMDEFGNWIINAAYNPEMLAEAVCKLEGFTYAPSKTNYWQHGQSSERDYIYVTTQTLTHAQMQALSEATGPGGSLLVMCSAYRGNLDAFANLTLRKIPKTVQDKCEWGKDDYSLTVVGGPIQSGEDDVEQIEPVSAQVAKSAPAQAKRRGRPPKANPDTVGQQNLF